MTRNKELCNNCKYVGTKILFKGTNNEVRLCNNGKYHFCLEDILKDAKVCKYYKEKFNLFTYMIKILCIIIICIVVFVLVKGI